MFSPEFWQNQSAGKLWRACGQLPAVLHINDCPSIYSWRSSFLQSPWGSHSASPVAVVFPLSISAMYFLPRGLRGLPSIGAVSSRLTGDCTEGSPSRSSSAQSPSCPFAPRPSGSFRGKKRGNSPRVAPRQPLTSSAHPTFVTCPSQSCRTHPICRRRTSPLRGSWPRRRCF